MSLLRSGGVALAPCLKLCLLLGLGLGLAATAAAEPTLEPGPGDEKLVYRWKIEGFKGLLLRLVAPGRGEGSLTTILDDSGNYATELHMSAESRRQGDFWRYGSSFDLAAQRSLRAWSKQKIGDKVKTREADLANEDVIDLASGILLVRREPPSTKRRMRIWSSGRVYPVEVESRGEERAMFRGRTVTVRIYSIHGYSVPGEREWNGGIEFHLADDASATPVEMVVLNKGVRARLLLDEAASQLGLPELRRAAVER